MRMPVPLPGGAAGRLRETAGAMLTVMAREGCGDHAVALEKDAIEASNPFPT